MAIDEAELEPLEFAEKMHTQQEITTTVAPVGTVHLALSITTQAAGLLAVVVFTLFHHHEADHRCDVVQHWREGWPASRRPRLGGLQVRLVGMVTGKMERNTDVSFTLDNDTGCINFSSDEEMAIDEAELEPLEFAEKMHTQQEITTTVAPVGTVHLALSITTQAAGLLAVVVFTLFHHHEADHRCDVVQHWREGWPASRRPRLGGLQVRLVGMVTGKMERNTDVSFTLDNDTGCINFSSDAHDLASLARVSDTSETWVGTGQYGVYANDFVK
uniref:OB domain-containing protein n=1 Tax=Triticum aestivum TaxID=4565 RepID=A0A077RXK4_WHEAT|nr:unnamed protein product [Triticum aestivum]